ncbi:hypothetical protein EA456_04735 [Streptococcus dysgalactiae subsp. dysgalactiae]|uniref:hypothetical protein n=1 Tax=Streptococcus TaxID=1301 RepID=UPI0006182F96|nr:MULTISPECIES: hypothetical protein [Streptococcus]KKC19257.1 hypothetical protein WH14_06230 [Streptococcus dysgalactiae subsp. equisimilis]MCL6222548.1 hypothetical protein [Streptococcus dysgalactiae subsp. equisimilis]QGG99842.1 hypothetical protein EA456_04735 [Streptococcus dysgalactiae subsp. dysgalactiae]QQC50522.1 hypothetical protein I6H74_05060 [Streptococcus dysgalactiae]UMY68730.1 hypothetical protein ML603_03265 [Streptococcus dysgalactiae subsp. equisimilis]
MEEMKSQQELENKKKKFADLADMAEAVKRALDLQSIAFDAIISIEDNAIRNLAAVKALNAVYDLNQCLSNDLQELHDKLYEEV